MPNLPVEFLIESGSGHWKEEVVREWFLPVDVQRILALPLGTISDDNWYWEGPSRGAYSVKEGYRRSVGEFTVCPGFSKWRQLWRVSVAPKLKVCVWRALRDILPTISSLNSKVIAGVWAIWKARNKAVWERQVPTPQSTVCLIRKLCKEVAFGCALFSPTNCFLAAINGELLCSPDPLMAEAMACREALSWIKTLDIHNVEILMDCQRVVSAISDTSFSLTSYFGSLIVECKALLVGFCSSSISFVRRELNVVAHSLARRAEARRSVWVSTPPDFVISLLQ
ncbi:unnamed protein product [Cuscuta campestris]|uniref:RNase H type-1 domain-containing protein n=1 Tax=Cuscuta campestris TaxID=132261 RepID=A0A484LHK6_9ASTE|nr:unnamed protein product [Cuscuta campestris]